MKNTNRGKPQELKLSCIFTGAWTDRALAVEVKLWLGSFSVSDPFSQAESW